VLTISSDEGTDVTRTLRGMANHGPMHWRSDAGAYAPNIG
jgi:hypothetical protein